MPGLGGEMLAVGPVPSYLVMADVVVAVDFFLSFKDNGVHRIEQVENVFQGASGEGYNVVGAAVDTVFWRQIYAAGKCADCLEHFFSGRAELGVVVAEGYGPRNTAVRQRLKDFKGAGNIGLAEEDVACVDYQVRFYTFQGVLNTLEGSFAPWISSNVVCIRELHHGELAVGTILKVSGNGKVRLLWRGCAASLEQRACHRACRHKCGPLEE